MNPMTSILSALFLLGLAGAPRTAQSPGPREQAAEALLLEGKWSEAAAAYDALTKSSPGSAQAWMRLGIARHELGEFARAIEAFGQAEQLFPPGPMRAGASFRRSRAHARANELVPAFEALDRALKCGFENLQAIQGDPDLAALRADPRFADTLALAEREIRPGLHLPEYAELSFLIGEWDVTMHGKTIATSQVRSEQDGCLLVEDYAQPDGSTARTFLYYDAPSSKWRRANVSNTAAVTEGSGTRTGDSMRFEGEWRTRHAGVTKFRETLTPIDADHVRQLFETTSDGGATWSVTYDLVYARRK